MGSSDARVGQGYVEIGPKLSKTFGSKLKTDIEAQLKPVEKSLTNLNLAARDAVSGLSGGTRAANQIKTSLDGASQAAKGLGTARKDLDGAAVAGGKVRASLDQATGSTVKLSQGSKDLLAKADQMVAKWDKVPASIGKSTKEIDNAAKSTDKLGNSANDSISKITRSAAGLVAAYAGVSFFRGVINDASDLSESTDKAGNVFKEATETVKRFSQTSAEAFGISTKGALEMGSTFGNLLTSMGLGRQAAADMSVNLLKLGADFASFNNISINEALDKLRAGLVGEFEPLRSLGVTLSANAVSAKAMELGLSSNAKQVSASAKIQATYALILEQSKNSQGDFARTSDGLANSQRILSAEWENAKTQIGAGLVPVFLELVQAGKELLPQFQELGTAVGGVLGKGLAGILPTTKLFLSAVTALAPVLEAIPAPLVAIVANVVLLEKALGKLGIENAITGPFKKLASTLNQQAVNSIDGLGSRMARKAQQEAAVVATVATGPRGFIGPLEAMFTSANPRIAAAAEQSVSGIGGKINRRIQAEIGDANTGRATTGLSAMFTRSKAPIQAAAVSSLDGLGSTLQKKLVTEYQRASPSEAIKALAPKLRAAQAAFSESSAAAVALQSAGPRNLAANTFTGIGTAAAQSAVQVDAFSKSARAASGAIQVTRIGEAAEGTRTFGQAVSGLAGVALPALGIGLAVSTAALGAWQERRAEAAAKQKEWTNAMVADAEAFKQAGGAADEAFRNGVGQQTKSIVTQELADKKRFDDLQRITDATGGNTQALKLYLEALDQVNKTGDKNNQSVKTFRQLLLDTGQVKLEPVLKRFANPEDFERARQEFINTGGAIDGFAKKGTDAQGIMDKIAGKSKSGILNQFESDVDRTGNSLEAINAQLSQTSALSDAPANAAKSMDLLKDSVDNTKDSFKDAKKQADDFAAAIRNLGGPAVDAIEAEESRQLSINRALDAVTNQDIPTADDITAATDKATNAANKRADAAAALATAQAKGNETEVHKAQSALTSAAAAEKSAQEALDKLQTKFDTGGLTAQDVLFGNTDDAIAARQGFRDTVQKTLDQAQIITATDGAAAGAAFWDQNIQAVKDRAPEWATVIDAEVQRRGITDGRSIFFKAALDPETPLTPELAKFLGDNDRAELIRKVIEVTVNASGDVPADIEPIIANTLNPAQKIDLAVKIATELGPDQAFDPSLIKGLDEAQVKTLALQLTTTVGAGSLPVDILKPLFADQAFTKDFLIDLRASGQSVDENTPLGAALKNAATGTPLEVLLKPKLDTTGLATGSPEADLIASVQKRAAELGQTKLSGEVATPGYIASADAMEQKFKDLDDAVEAARRKTVDFNAVVLNPKTVTYLEQGGERFDEARRKYAEFNQAPNITKTVTLDVQTRNLEFVARQLALLPFGGIVAPPTAMGGIFNDPEVRLIAEAGQEAVIPTSENQHARAAQLLAEGGFFDRFSKEFLAHVGATATPAAATAAGGSITQNFYTNDSEVVARKVQATIARELAGI